LLRNHVVDAARLLASGFELTWPDATAGILSTLEDYERTGWAPFRPARHDRTRSDTVDEGSR